MPTNPIQSTFETALEQGVSTTKKAVANQLTQTAKNVSSQVTGSTQSQGMGSDQASSPTTDVVTGVSDQFNETGNGQQQKSQQQTQDPQQNAVSLAQMNQKAQEENQEKLVKTRRHLEQHKQTYYDKLTQRPQDPTVEERLEQQDQEKEKKKMEDIQEQRKKETPVALRQAKTRIESRPGAG